MSKIILLTIAGFFLQVCFSSPIDIIVELSVEIEGTKAFVDLEAKNAASILNHTKTTIDDAIKESNSTLANGIKNLEISVYEAQGRAIRNRKSIVSCLNKERSRMLVIQASKAEFFSCRQLVELVVSKKYIKGIENAKSVLDGTVSKCIENNPSDEVAMRNCGLKDINDVKSKVSELKLKLRTTLDKIAKNSSLCNHNILEKLSTILDKTYKDFSTCVETIFNE